MGGAASDGPEVALVAEAVAHATARLRLYRVAFGVAGAGQPLGRSETELLLTEAYGGGRLKVTWGVTGDQPRAEVKIAFLLLQCAEAALPRGGEVHVSVAGGRWRIDARSDRVQADNDLWHLLDGTPMPAALKPAEVQFALAPRAASAIGRRIAAEIGTNTIALSF